MAPSVTEAISQSSDHIQEKLAAISVKDINIVETRDEPAPAVQEPEAIKAPEAVKEPESQTAAQLDQPAINTQHKEPLKLSGALDGFKSFDVTPVIGREFVDVNLKEWLRAPNSDELLKDLAITSTQNTSFYLKSLTDVFPSLPTRGCFLQKAR